MITLSFLMPNIMTLTLSALLYLCVLEVGLGLVEVLGLGHAAGLLGLGRGDPGLELLAARGGVGQVLDVLSELLALGLDLVEEGVLQLRRLSHAADKLLQTLDKVINRL